VLRRALLLVVVALLPVGGAAAPRAAGGSSRTSSEVACRAAVQRFYDSYARLVHEENPRAPWDRAVKAYRTSFDPELRRWLAVDAAARARQPDDIVGLDFDPFLNSQDPARQYRVKRISRSKSGMRVYVHAVYAGKVSPAPSVVPELVLRRGRWTFLNFYYPIDGTDIGTLDLLSFLKGRDRERRQGR
jgi:hypothetical protein